MDVDCANSKINMLRRRVPIISIISFFVSQQFLSIQAKEPLEIYYLYFVLSLKYFNFRQLSFNSGLPLYGINVDCISSIQNI
jgi:hypothetical protein